MAYWHCLYHVIWTTKNRAPLISAQIEPLLYAVFASQVKQLECKLLAANGVEDHVYLAVAIPPKWSVAECVKRMKGNSTHAINKHFPNLETRFAWQEGYGALTFGRMNIDFVVHYVQNQKEHHRQATFLDELERTDDT